MTVRKMGARNKRKPFTSMEYPKGRGKIKCELCGFPLRDHKLNTHEITKMQAQA